MGLQIRRPRRQNRPVSDRLHDLEASFGRPRDCRLFEDERVVGVLGQRRLLTNRLAKTESDRTAVDNPEKLSGKTVKIKGFPRDKKVKRFWATVSSNRTEYIVTIAILNRL